MTAFEKDDLYSSIPDDQPIPDKPAPPAWNVVAKKKPAKPKDKEEPEKTPALPIACKFYKLGKCSAGKTCRFSHDPNAPMVPDTTEPPAPTLPCKFHAAGYCRNGPKCPFLHASAKKSAPAPPVNTPIPVSKPNGIHAHAATPSPIIAIINNHPSTANTTTNPQISTTKQTSPIPTSLSPSTIRPPPSSDIPFPIARSPTTTQQHANIMNIWPASPPVSAPSSLHSTSFFSSSPTSTPSSFSPRHMTNAIPSLASLPSSPSFLSSSPFAMFMSTKPEEDEEDEDDELLPIPGLTIIDDTQDDFVFNPYDDILNTDDDFHTMSTYQNGKSNHVNPATNPATNPSTNVTTHTSTSSPAPTEPEGSQQRTFADILKTNITVSKSVELLAEEEKQMDEMNNKLCQFYVQGICRYGSGCRYVHGNVCDSCGKPCLLLDNPQQNEEHLLSCALQSKMLEERQASKDVDCGICYEKTVDKGRRFGLLSHCDHPFCLECIREWRGGTGAPTTTLRSCPICRVTSYYIIPSEGMVFDPERKKDIIEQYKSKLTTITCKYFNNGKGVCKFGTSCMYSHTNPDGTPFVPPTPRKMQDAEGEVTFYNGLKLGAFFDVM
eukprot:Phypoly_transcript_05616.p1 GENE.Phypoly_transcript_05616~~Phypoly_transcript_05616.p1  ORF type:complete len:606 (-),score=134.44 Phypoly_transcript_05616:2-1819(-)